MQGRTQATPQVVLDKRLTLVIKAGDEAADLRRAVAFHRSHPFQILVIDTSEQAAHDIGGGIPQVDYRHLPECTDAQKMLAYVTAQVKTPYMVLLDAQSFCVPDALVQCLDFLEQHPDHGVCLGYSLVGRGMGASVEYYIADRKGPEHFDAPDAARRLLDYMTHYLPVSGAVMRTALVASWCDVAPAVDARYQSLGLALFLLLNANARILPIAYSVRVLQYPESEAILPASLAGSGPDQVLERERFAGLMAGLLSTSTGAGSVQGSLVREALEALEECLRSQAAREPEPVFEARYSWQEAARYAFRPTQYVQLPFYNEAFFDVLERVGFLLLALPSGVVQLKALEPLVIRQQALARDRFNEAAPDRDARIEAALDLYPFDAELAQRLLASIRQRQDQTLAGLLEAWIERLDQVQPTGKARIMGHSQSGLLYGRLHAWKPSLEQQQAIAGQDGPAFGLVLLDLQGDMDALQVTLDSVLESYYKRYQIVVLTTARPPVPTREQDRLHFVQVQPTQWQDQMNRVVARAAWDWLLCADVGVQFSPSGLMKVALELTGADQCRAVYCDELQRRPDGTLGSLYRPSFNLDLLLSSPRTMAAHWFIRREVFLAAGGYSARFPNASAFDFILRLIESEGMSGIGHIDDLLLVSDLDAGQGNADELSTLQRHLRVRGYERSRVLQARPGEYQINYGHADRPLVSIIIPTRDQLGLVSRCVETVLERTRYKHFEIILVDNLSEAADAVSWLDGIEAMGDEKLRVLRYPHPFNFSAMNNHAAAHARGEYLVLLNNDTAVIDDNWLDELLNHALRPEVGIVGARLHFPDGTLQHAGVVLGLRGPAEHPLLRRDPQAPGYMGRARLDQNFSAVTAACLMIRKSVYEQVGGLDEQAFGVSYNDVDLCLKVGQAGYLNVWAQRAVLMHEGSVSQATVDPLSQSAKRQRFVREQNAFYQRWMPLIVNDPAYNRNLSLCSNDFEVDRKPLLDPALRTLPMILVMADSAQGADAAGAWRALGSAADVTVPRQRLLIADLLRMAPDVLVIPGEICHMDLLSLQHFHQYYEGLKVLDLRGLDAAAWTRGGEQHEAVRGALPLVDRLLVSDEALARILGGLHPDVRLVVPVSENPALMSACLP
ncbi:MAG TPA: glycosyltransferase [Pseudomonas sp.]|uniref:glycosyltransferase n=1 Tax=Pseudomonas sp. TaxID=306 RepID=UPI002B4791C6|nr:glycosyltransferase [Pseudomonas sp.]HKS11867.1 glycosyltransferase [Pseudomonas sp.]